MRIGMNIRTVYAYGTIFYVNTEYEYIYRGTVCVWKYVGFSCLHIR